MTRNTVIERDQPIQTLTPEAASQQENLLTVTEVARRLRVDSTTVRRWITNGVLERVLQRGRGENKYMLPSFA